MRADHQARGQALAETALGLLVFVSFLMVGVHLVEVGFLSMKVQEAATSALWDATAYRTQRPTVGGVADLTPMLQRVEASATDRHRDYDGRSASRGDAPRLAFTHASPIQVRCQREPGMTFSLGLDPSTNPRFQDTDGIGCAAVGGVVIANLPSAFDQRAEGGHFAELFRPATSTIPLCSSGRPPCAGRLSLLIGDHGFSGGQTDAPETLDCPVQRAAGLPCANASLYALTQDLFDRSVPQWMGAGDHGDYAAQWARNIVNRDPPGRERGITGFYLSYRGRNHAAAPFEEVAQGERWEAQPHSRGSVPSGEAFERRASCGAFCYLGRFPVE